MNFLKQILPACAVALAMTTAAHAATVVDTGTPNGVAVGADFFNSIDWYAAEISVAEASRIDAVYAHVLGGAPGETFTISLYAADAGNVPGTPLYTATATYGTDGWNGAAGLTWDVSSGSYWVGLEVQPTDTLGTSSVTGGLLDLGAPSPLAHWAEDTTGFGYYDAIGSASLGLRVDAISASAVPESASGLLMLAGLPLLAAAARRRSQRQPG